MNKLFFTDRFYRKMWLLRLKGKIMKPIGFIQAIWNTIKLYRDYPDKWDRYVKLKEDENKAAEQRKKEKIIIARSNFIGAAFRINLCQLFAINPEHTEEQQDKNFAEFQQSRKELQEAIEELEGYGEIVPEELKSELLKTPIDTFKSIEEWEVFTERFNKKINDF